MSVESPPTYTTSIFNQSNFNTTAGGLDTAYLNAHYLKYPTAQTGLETIANLATTNDATINGLTVGKGGGSAASNTAFGVSALSANTIGVNNVALGYQALKSNTQGDFSIAIGYQALTSATTNGYCVAIGFGALSSNLTGRYNVAVGGGSLNSSTGTQNTALGHYSLYSLTTGSYNVAVGYNAGFQGTAITTGSNNTFVGFNTQSNGAGYNQSTALGSGATITASNQVVLGTTTETVVIPRRIRFLDAPNIFRSGDNTQSINSFTDTTVFFPTLNSTYSGSYTGITYSAGVFTNSNSYPISVNVAANIGFSFNTVGVRWIILVHSVLGRIWISNMNAATDNFSAMGCACNFRLLAGESFYILAYHSSTTSPLTLLIGGGTPNISISVLA